MIVRRILTAVICLMAGSVFSGSAFAMPTLDVTSVVGGSDITWTVTVSPDPTLDTGADGSSIAAELAFTSTSAITSLTNVASNFDTSNPGNNPNTGTVTNGSVIEAGGLAAFSSYGSIIFDPIGTHDAFTVVTTGTAATTLNVGGILAQEGTNYTIAGADFMAGGGGLACDTLMNGGCTIEDLDALITGGGDDAAVTQWLADAGTENGTTYFPGDADLMNGVNIDDFVALSLAFGNPSTVWSQGNFTAVDTTGTNIDDFVELSLNFGNGTGSVSAVPEPSSFVLAGLMALVGFATRRNS